MNPFETVGGALRRRHRLVWLPALAAIAAAGLLVAVLPATYEATALLGLDEQQEASLGFDLALQADQYLTQRYVAMATSQPVLARVCAQAGAGCDPDALGAEVTAAPTKAAGVIGVTVRARSAVEAARMATAVAQQVVVQNQAQAAATAAPTRSYLSDQLSQLEQQQQAIQARLAATPSAAQAPLLAELTMTQQQYTATYGRIQDANVQQAQLSAALLLRQAAQVPSSPADPDVVRYVLVAAAAGLTSGFLLALLVDLLDRRVRDGGDLAAATGADVVLDADPRSAATECCALLLHVGAGASTPGDVLVVAASRDDPAAEVADDLARAAAELGRLMTVAVAAAPTVDPRTLLRARSASAAVLVATRGRTAGADARRTAHLLRRAGVEVRAAVLLP